METPSPQQRLLELAAGRGVSLSQLSRMIGRNPSYLQQFVRKGSPRKLEESDRSTLARFFNVDEADLGAPEENSFDPAVGRSGKSDWVDIPRLDIGVSAGPGAVGADEQPFATLRFARRWLRQHGLDPAMLTTVEVIGDSMEPTLRDGDEILVDRATALRDGVHVVRLDNALLVKRLDTSRAGRLVLISDNRSYPPVEIALKEAQVIGRAVWKSGKL